MLLYEVLALQLYIHTVYIKIVSYCVDLKLQYCRVLGQDSRTILHAHLTGQYSCNWYCRHATQHIIQKKKKTSHYTPIRIPDSRPTYIACLSGLVTFPGWNLGQKATPTNPHLLNLHSYLRIPKYHCSSDCCLQTGLGMLRNSADSAICLENVSVVRYDT